MFYSRVYKGKGYNKPNISDHDSYDYVTDPDLRKILKTTLRDNHYNNEAAYLLDSLAPSYCLTVAYTIVGNGLKVTVENDPESEKAIQSFNKHINMHHDTIDDYIVNKIIDNFIFGFDLHRIHHYPNGVVDLMRVSPKTIKREIDPYEGWVRFVQQAPNAHRHKSYDDFIHRRPEIVEPTPQVTVLEDNPYQCIYTRLFRTAPMSHVSHLIVYKRWIFMFLRKHAERMWSPVRIGYVGDPTSGNMPPNPTLLQEGIDNLDRAMDYLRNFSHITIPGNYRIEKETPTDAGASYLKTIEVLNEEIMFGLLGSMGVRRTTQTFKSNATVDENIVQVLNGIRNKIEEALRLFYTTNIVPNVDPNKIICHWSPLRVSSIGEYTTAIETLFKLGAFKDTREFRRAASIIIPFIAEHDITDQESTEMRDFAILMNAPSQPDESTPDVMHRGKKNNPDKNTSADQTVSS